MEPFYTLRCKARKVLDPWKFFGIMLLLGLFWGWVTVFNNPPNPDMEKERAAYLGGWLILTALLLHVYSKDDILDAVDKAMEDEVRYRQHERLRFERAAGNYLKAMSTSEGELHWWLVRPGLLNLATQVESLSQQVIVRQQLLAMIYSPEEVISGIEELRGQFKKAQNEFWNARSTILDLAAKNEKKDPELLKLVQGLRSYKEALSITY